MQTITLGHSPDADDAFMFYALAQGRIPTGDLRFVHTLQDIETLNRRAQNAELDVTALSIHAYAYVADRYALLRCGASVGENYGPIVVAKRAMSAAQLRRCRIAVPGEWTTAFLAAELCLGEFEHTVVPFDQIIEVVQGNRADAGLVIHEGQLTFAEAGLQKILDLGRWWAAESGLALPLGANAVRKSLEQPLKREISRYVKASIEYALANRREALQYARSFARGLAAEQVDRFVQMYVNDYTVDLGERGKRSIEALLERAVVTGFLKRRIQIEFVE